MKKIYNILLFCLFLYPATVLSSPSPLPEKKDVPCPQFCHLMTDEEFVDRRFYETIYPICTNCWRILLSPILIIQDNLHGTVTIQECKLLENKKNFIKYECYNNYAFEKKSIIEYEIMEWDPLYQGYLVQERNFNIKEESQRSGYYIIKMPKQEKD
ncbi:MAG: hypothetical protein J6L86_03725 [Alphaproteobacteria bacterium]|nr:hypothetical protein [Alphaproteobacteria bacterium]